MNYRRYRGGAILLLLAAVSHSAPALAEPSSNQKNMARPLTLQGREKLKAGDAATASKLFQAAHAVMRSPVTGLDVAKAEVALGHLVEARDAALEVTRIPVSPGEPKVVKEARSEAAQLATDLAGRIPSLVIRVAGPRSAVAAVSVRLDRAEIRVAEKTVPRGPRAVSPSPLVAHQSSGRNVPAWAWGAGGVGLVALGFSVYFAVDYANVRSTVAFNCSGDVCGGDIRDTNTHIVEQALRDKWNHDLWLMVGLGGVGLLGVGASVYEIVVTKTGRRDAAPRSAPAGATLVPWLSPGVVGAGFQGVF